MSPTASMACSMTYPSLHRLKSTQIPHQNLPNHPQNCQVHLHKDRILGNIAPDLALQAFGSRPGASDGTSHERAQAHVHVHQNLLHRVCASHLDGAQAGPHGARETSSEPQHRCQRPEAGRNGCVESSDVL